MPTAVIAGGLGAVGSLVGGALSGRSKTYTNTTTPTWDPQSSALKDQLSSYSSSLLSDPSAGLSPIKANLSDSINRRYAAIPGKVSQSLAARGYGSSGDFGNTLYQNEYQRSGEQSNLESTIAQMMLAQKNTGASLSEQLLGMTRGTTTTGNTPSTAAGDAFQSAGNGLSNLSTLLMLSKVLKGAGGGNGNSDFLSYANANPFNPTPGIGQLPTLSGPIPGTNPNGPTSLSDILGG